MRPRAFVFCVQQCFGDPFYKSYQPCPLDPNWPHLGGECLECLKNQCLHFFSVAIDRILLKLADKEEMQSILDVLKFSRQYNYMSLGIQKYPNWVIMGKTVSQFFLVIYLLDNNSRYFDDFQALR